MRGAGRGYRNMEQNERLGGAPADCILLPPLHPPFTPPPSVQRFVGRRIPLTAKRGFGGAPGCILRVLPRRRDVGPRPLHVAWDKHNYRHDS